MQLRRAVEIMNNKSNMGDAEIYFNNKKVCIESIDTNIGTAYVKSMDDNCRFEVELEQLHEKKIH